MWQLDSPALPDVDEVIDADLNVGLPLAYVDSLSSYAGTPLARLDFASSFYDPGILRDEVVEVESIQVPTFVGDSFSLFLTGAQNVVSLQAGVGSFVPAMDPDSPQPGEFTFDRETGEVRVFMDDQRRLTPDLFVQVIKAAPAVPTGVISAELFGSLANLPATGQIAWTLNAEQHPSGQLDLLVYGDDIDQIRAVLKNGAEITFAGIGFSVGQPQERLLNTEEYPGRFYEYSVPLIGKWQRSIYNELVYLNPDAARALFEANEKDTQTQVGSFDYQTAQPDQLTVQELARRRGAVFRADAPAGGGNAIAVDLVAAEERQQRRVSVIRNTRENTAGRQYTIVRKRNGSRYALPESGQNDKGLGWNVEIPQNTPGDASVRWADMAQERLRKNGCFIDFNNPDAVYARNVYNVSSWDYTPVEISIGYQGDAERSPDYRGYGIEHRNARIEGIFNEEGLRRDDGEDVSGQRQTLPRWKKRYPKTEIVPVGENPPPMPDDAVRLTTMSLNWDVSGDTRAFTKKYIRDGAPVREEVWIWGWAYTASDIADNEGYLDADPSPYWQVVEYRNTVYIYNEDYRLLTDVVTRGWKLLRIKQETDEDLATIELPTNDPEFPLYQWRRVPIYGSTQYRYRQFYEFYKDVSDVEQPSFSVLPYTAPTGSTAYKVVYDPNWVPSFFVEQELTYYNCFASAPNPESSPDFPLPNLIAGEERMSHTKVKILASKNIRGDTRAGSLASGGSWYNEDRYVVERIEYSPQGQGFEDQSMTHTSETVDGKPGQAAQTPPLYELTDDSDQRQAAEAEAVYEYRVCSPGWDFTDPSADSVTPTQAKTAEEAMRFVKTDYKIRDVLESVGYEFLIPFNARIRPLDVIACRPKGHTHQLRAISIRNTVSLQRAEGQSLFISEGTQISAGIDREVPLQARRLPKPKRDTSGILRAVVIRNRDLRVGNIIPPTLRTRRRP